MKHFQLNSLALLTTLALCATQKAHAETANHSAHDHTRVDSHAPISVMGDHLMNTGEWMVSYRLMNMHMEGMRSGTDDLTSDQVALMPNALGGESMRMGNLADGSPRIMTVPGTYRIVPQEMDMRMHMLGMMYGFSRKVTGVVMLNYLEKEMTSLTYQGMAGDTQLGTFTGKTSGIGDTKVAALIRLDDSSTHTIHLNAGISLPTGSITESGSVLPPFSGMMGTVPGELVEIDRLGYNMQLGSGTVDLEPGITYSAHQGDLSWGGQFMSKLRLYDNKEDYRLGNVFEVTSWVAQRWQKWLSTSARVSARSEGGIKGRDTVITGGNPVSDPANSGRDEVNLLFGVNLRGTNGWAKGQRLALEIGAPIYEKVDGVQMSKDWTATLGWQTIF